MIRYRKMQQEDLDYIIQSKEWKNLLGFEPNDKELFCFLGEDNGEIVVGLSGTYSGNSAYIEHLILQEGKEHAIKDGLVRSTIHMLERMEIQFLETNIDDDVFKHIGFKQRKKGTWMIDCIEFFQKPGC